MEDHEQPEHVYFMERALAKLISLPAEMKNKEYIEICKLMDKYVKMHCNHSIITDLIDIDPDRSKTIRYCEYCYANF